MNEHQLVNLQEIAFTHFRPCSVECDPWLVVVARVASLFLLWCGIEIDCSYLDIYITLHYIPWLQSQ
jgi:hypothetical protein